MTPAHNAAAYLGEAVESVFAQTYEDWELVIVDDASSDASLEIAKGYEAARPGAVRALGLERNRGPAVARNEAIAASRGGELVALLDADDRWREDYLERQVGAFDAAGRNGGNPGIAACDALVEAPEGVIGRFGELFGWTEPITYDDMLERSYVMVSALFSRAAFDEVGGFSPDCWGSEDYDLWLRIMEAGYSVVTTREPLAVYRHHPEGLSKDQVKMADAALAAYGRALGRTALTSSQRRYVRARVRHYKALRARASLGRAVRARDPRLVLTALAQAALWAPIALLQDPSRWREWLADARAGVARAVRR